MDKDNGPGLRDSWSTVLVAVTSERMLGKEASCHGGGIVVFKPFRFPGLPSQP